MSPARLFVASLCAALNVACASVPQARYSARDFAERYPAAVETLVAGDVLRLSLYGDDAFSDQYQVASDGTLSLPLLGAVAVAGLSLEEARARIEAGLRDGYYPQGQLSAQIVSQRPVYILGEVARPGSFAFVADLTLSKVVALAGGYTPFASMHTIAVRRAGGEEVLVEADQALAIAPGDTVRILPRSL